MKQFILPCMLAAATLPALATDYAHTVQAEKINRGIVAVSSERGVLVSWRSLVTDERWMTFDVYRDGVKINGAPIDNSTNFMDAEGSADCTYEVRCLVNGSVVDSQSTKAWDSIYRRVHLDRPEGGISPAGGSNEMREYTYTPDDVSVGDVDGDGEYELFVKWHPTNQADNSFRRFTGNTYIDCYKLDGTKLWRIDLGINIRSGNHYTQFMVYDFDNDGEAEMICKTAPGTIDGQGQYVIMGDDDPHADYRLTGTNAGIILSGPEYLTVFDGATGAELSTIAYNPPRNVISNWGDNYGNRCERYLACVAYLDGKHPSAVFCRGYYTAAYLWAVDFDGIQLTERWLYEAKEKGKGAYGEGAHAITVGDVDGDGCDEIVYGAAAIDHDGTLLYRTGAGHGDALHLAAMLPEREGLQVFMPHEEKSSGYKWDAELRDARTGEILFGNPQSGNDNGRGLAANVSDNWSGYEYWSSQHRNPQNHGENVGNKNLSINFRIYWDDDLLDELLDGTIITKPNANITSVSSIAALSNYSHATSCNDTKKTPNLQADLFGDWREEIILHDSSTESDLLIFSTPIPTRYKVPCLMQDRQYRLAVAWQNVAYNQPPHLGYNLEESFGTKPSIMVTEGSLNQVIYLGDPIQPIGYKLKNCNYILPIQQPEWMSHWFNDVTYEGKLSGTPTEIGEYHFRFKSDYNSDVESEPAYMEGKIVVRENPGLTMMAQYPFDWADNTTPNSVYGHAVAYKGNLGITLGKIGYAAIFDGNIYYVQNGYDAFNFGNDDFTIEMWIRSTDQAAYLLHKGSLAANAATGATGNWVGIELKNNQLKFAIDDDVTKTGIDVNDASQWFDDEWHHIVMVRDTYAKKLYAYIDGELQGETDDLTGAVRCENEDLVIGNVNVNFNNTFKGVMDHLTIYKGAMSPSKIKANYEFASITDVEMDFTGPTTYTVVDAMSGRIIREVKGEDRYDIIDGLAPGIYLLVKTTGTTQEVFKFIK